MIIPLDAKRHRVAEWLPKIQHLIGGLPLLAAGIARLGDVAERPIAIAEIVVAGLVCLAFLKDVYVHLRAHGHAKPSFGWFDLVAGGLLMFEAFHGAHGKPGYLRPQFLAGVLTIAIGLFHARFHTFKSTRRVLRMDAEGLEFRLSWFRRFSLAWDDLESIDLTGAKAIFLGKDGRRRTYRLSMFHNEEAVRQGLAEQATAAGVLTRQPEPAVIGAPGSK